MLKIFKTLLVGFILSALAACNLPIGSLIPLPTLAQPIPLPTNTQPMALPTMTQQITLPTATVPPTAISPFTDWLTYTNQKYGFALKYPQSGQISDSTDISARIQLPFVQDTNLEEKYLDVSVAENISPCSNPDAQQYSPGTIQPQPVIINSLPFILESGMDAGMGNIYEWASYSTVKGIACVSLTFVLHSSNPAMYSTPPAVFDNNAESAVFVDLVSTFTWLNP